MTRHFLTLKDCATLGRCGDVILQSDKSAAEIGMDELVEKGFFRELTAEEAAKLHREAKHGL